MGTRDRAAVDEECSLRRFVERENQVRQSRFPAAGRPNDGQARTCRNLQIDVAQNRRLAVAEVEMPEFDFSVQHGSVRSRSRERESSVMTGLALRISSMRFTEAVPRWKMLITQPTAMMGQISMIM